MNAIDSKTKYVLAHLFIEKRSMAKCVEFLRQIKITCYEQIFERYNQDIKDRIKTMRNFGSDKGAEYFLNLKHIIHNFVNPHMQLKGKTPAEAAGIDLRLRRRKLLNLIKSYAKNKHHSLR